MTDPAHHGVIETATGILLRAGFVSFVAGAGETERTDVPHPAQVRGDQENALMDRWDGSLEVPAWVEVTNVLEELVDIKEQTTTAVDTNDGAAVGAWFDVDVFKTITLRVVGKTGTHAAHVVKLVCSVGAKTPYVPFGIAGTPSVTGDGLKMHISVSCRYVRWEVVTPEGSASTCDVLIQAKP